MSRRFIGSAIITVLMLLLVVVAILLGETVSATMAAFTTGLWAGITIDEAEGRS